MPSKKLMFIFGTRPEAIKMAPLILKVKQYSQLFECSICVTGQHGEILDQVLEFFGLTPDYNLTVMKKGQSLADLTANLVSRVSQAIIEEQPDLVLVHGDTTTSMAAALASFYEKVPVAHVEAGLRTFSKFSPFPEELNRVMTGNIADYHFAPTSLARENLVSEGKDKSAIYVTGNTVIDALHLTLEKISQDLDLSNRLRKQFSFLDFNKKIILITTHRRENFGKKLVDIFSAVKSICLAYPDCQVVLPLHPNPKVKEALELAFFAGMPSNFFEIRPLDYVSMIFIIDKSFLILTDSGGIQEEAPSLGKPVLVLRDSTERPEALRVGTVILVGSDKQKIRNEVDLLLNDSDRYLRMSKINNPYGDGTACDKILKVLKTSFSLNI